MLFFVLISTPVGAVRHYQATIEQAFWEVESSRIRCELNQIIPYYGKGRFVISAGGELSFVANTFAPMVREGTVSVISIPPFWRAVDAKELGQSILSKGHMPFHITKDLATRMLSELDAGMQPTFKYKDSYDDVSDVLVSFSSVRVQDKLHDFHNCISQLLPYGASQLKPVIVNFKTNKHRLSRSVKQDLEVLALFAKEDKSIKIQVEGHTDNRGSRRHNLRLSKLRSNSVKNHLISMGVRASQIQMRSHGERKPMSTNRKFMGRAFNRRVEVSFTHNIN